MSTRDAIRGRRGRSAGAGRLPTRLLAALAVLACAATAAGVLVALDRQSVSKGPAGSARAGAAAAKPARTDTVRVSIPRRPVLTTVPRSFLGISTEYWALPTWASHLTLLDRVLSLLRSDGPITLRIGGDSADQTFWAPGTELPEWTYELSRAWLNDVSRIVRQSHLHVILDLNLVTATPQTAAFWARTALANLPAGSVIGVEIGNEPDIYLRSYWQKKLAHQPSLVKELPERITATSYAQDYARYAQILHGITPRPPLLAPALANPRKNVNWVSTLLARPHPNLSTVTAHIYPYSACSARGAATHPTIGRILSERATAGMADTARRIQRLSERWGLPLALTEINSVTCGGTGGISDTFATALWAPDALFELARTGAESVDVHVRRHTINQAFALNARGLLARPLLYGMIAFARTLGPGAQLVPLQLSPHSSQHLKAWAVRVRGNILHVLLINKSSRTVTLSLALPATHRAAVQRLTAASIRATSGMSLGGQHLDNQGRWRGTPRQETLNRAARGYALVLPRYSAALVTVNLSPGALTGASVRVRN